MAMPDCERKHQYDIFVSYTSRDQEWVHPFTTIWSKKSTAVVNATSYPTSTGGVCALASRGMKPCKGLCKTPQRSRPSYLIDFL